MSINNKKLVGFLNKMLASTTNYMLAKHVIYSKAGDLINLLLINYRESLLDLRGMLKPCNSKSCKLMIS